MMPQTKTQGAVFGLLMSYFMALGMEVSNVAHKLGAMSNAVFLPALKETVFMGAIVFVVSTLYGSRAGQHIAHKFVRPGRDNPLPVSGCTVMVMCPSMSLIATALFTGIDAEFFARFLATLYRNLPWALLWQIFAAGPATRGVFRAIFRRQLMENDRKAFSSDTECDKMDA